MKKISKILLYILILILPIFSFASEYFVIEHYQVNVDVQENNSYRITEIIDVEFDSPRHGIFRKLPLMFDKNRIKISDISIPNFDYETENNIDEIKIRIGSPDILVEGKVQYIISYTYDVGADDLPEMDEFYHNIIGTEWDTEIKAVDFTINMPKYFDAKKVNCTSGNLGSKDNTKVEWKVEGNKITGRTLAPLLNFQSLTVALPLPEGYWINATKHSREESIIYKILGYPLYAVLIILSVLIWYKKGKDKKLFPTIQFEPPESLTPAEIGYIIDGSVDGEDVTSLILYWADQGLLEIEENEKKSLLTKSKILTITKLKDISNTAKSYEKSLFKAMFRLGDGEQVSTTDLTNKFYTNVEACQSSIENSFKKDKPIYTKKGESFSFLTGIFAMLPIIILLIKFFTDVEGDSGPILIFTPFIAIFFVIPAVKFFSIITGHRGKSIAGLIIFFILMSFALFVIYLMTVITAYIPLEKYIAAMLTSIIVSFFTSIMSKRTEYGDNILEKVLGFKEFIENAENNKLETMFEQNPSYFFNVLPYAMVMGISKKWAKHFETITLQPPTWYRGYKYDTFRATRFCDDLTGSFNTLNTAMTSSPSKSSGSSGGSSSGGSSGGGSGGGGGGSW